MSKEELKDKIIEIKKSDKEPTSMMCPFRTHQINYQLSVSGTTEVHQKAEFGDCYLEHCFYYQNKMCAKIAADVGNTRR